MQSRREGRKGAIMKRPLIGIAATLLFMAQMGIGCVDPVLRTNTNPKVLFRRYQQVTNQTRGNERGHSTAEAKGAASLLAHKQDCFLYPNLRSQTEIPCLAPLFRTYQGQPKSTRMVPTTCNGKEVKIAVHLVGDDEHNTTLVCIPGVMSDASEYRFVIGALAEEFDFWVIDPPGCGASDAPDPARLGPGGYSPEAVAERELQAIAACLAELKRPVRIQLLAHSMGGLVALRAFADPELRGRYREVLERIDGLILISPCDVFISQINQTLIARSELSGLSVNIGRGLGVVREKVAQYLAGSFYASHCLAKEEVDHAVRVLTDTSTRRAFQAMLQEALPFDLETHQPRFEKMQRLEACYTNVTLPVLILWGKCDQVLPVATGYMLEKQLPNARLIVLPDCKHAPNLECPLECARAIRTCQQEILAQRGINPRVAGVGK